MTRLGEAAVPPNAKKSQHRLKEKEKPRGYIPRKRPRRCLTKGLDEMALKMRALKMPAEDGRSICEQSGSFNKEQIKGGRQKSQP